MDAAVGDKFLERQAGDFTTDWVEAREQDGVRAVVDDDLYAGKGFEGPDVTAFTTDDAPLDLVVFDVEHAHGVLDGSLGSSALDGLQHYFLGHLVGTHLGVFGDLLHIYHGLGLGVILDELNELFFGVFD